MGTDEFLSFSQNYSCGDSNFTIPDLEPRLFSFNTPIGACPYCNGLGLKLEVAEELVCDPTKSLLDGGIIPYKNNDADNLNNAMIEELCKTYDISMTEPISNIPSDKLKYVLYGSPDQIHFKMKSSSGRVHEKVDYFEGIINNLSRRYRETTSEWIRTWIEGFMTESECPMCHGARLNEQALSVKIGSKKY